MNKQELHDFYFDAMGMCGCGSPDEIVKLLDAVLRCHKFEEWNKRHMELDKLLPTSGVKETYLHWLSSDTLGLLEHGGSVHGSWLTEKGRDVINAIEKYGFDPSDWEYEVGETGD